MSLTAFKQTVNRPVVSAVWILTIVALVPFSNLACLLVGAAASLTANSMALYLLCSRSRVDRIHGAARLAIQIVIVSVGAVAIARSGVGISGLYHYFAGQMK